MCLCPRRSGKRTPRQTQEGPGSRPSVATALPGRLGTYPCEPNVTRLAHRDSIHPTSLAHHVRDALLPQQGPGCRPPRRLLIFPVPWRTRLPGHCPPPLSDALPAAQPAASAWPSTPQPLASLARMRSPPHSAPQRLDVPLRCPGRWLEDAVDAEARTAERRRRRQEASPASSLLLLYLETSSQVCASLQNRRSSSPALTGCSVFPPHLQVEPAWQTGTGLLSGSLEGRGRWASWGRAGASGARPPPPLPFLRETMGCRLRPGDKGPCRGGSSRWGLVGRPPAAARASGPLSLPAGQVGPESQCVPSAQDALPWLQDSVATFFLSAFFFFLIVA